MEVERKCPHLAMCPIFLFDVDGVLVDVRPSYHETIMRTTVMYLRQVLGLLAPDDLLTREHVAVLKRVGGFNNDWYSVAAILHILVAELPPTPVPDSRTVSALHATARGLASLPDLEERLRRGAQRLLDLEDEIHARGGSLRAVRALVSGHNAHLVIHDSWLAQTNPIVRVYQELYLGPDLFRQVYGLSPRYYEGPPLIDQDERIISPETLDNLAARHRLGLVTGRPHVEAEYTLRRLGLWHYFHVLVGYDDVAAEMRRRGTNEYLGKPNPWPLSRAARQIDPTGKMGVAYVGDTVDDTRAAIALRAERATYAIGCTFAYSNPETVAARLRAAGADMIVHHPDELRHL